MPASLDTSHDSARPEATTAEFRRDGHTGRLRPEVFGRQRCRPGGRTAHRPPGRPRDDVNRGDAEGTRAQFQRRTLSSVDVQWQVPPQDLRYDVRAALKRPIAIHE